MGHMTRWMYRCRSGLRSCDTHIVHEYVLYEKSVGTESNAVGNELNAVSTVTVHNSGGTKAFLLNHNYFILKAHGS